MTTAQKVSLATLLLGFLLVFIFAEKPSLAARWSCGHELPFSARLARSLSLGRSSHCCQSSRLVHDLKNVAIAQRLYHYDYNQFAMTLHELTNKTGCFLRLPPAHQFQSDGTNWSLTAPQNGSLAGNYLINQSGTVYFHESRLPTQFDLVLSKPN